SRQQRRLGADPHREDGPAHCGPRGPARPVRAEQLGHLGSLLGRHGLWPGLERPARPRPRDRHPRRLGAGNYYKVSRDWGKKPIPLPNGTKAHAWPNTQQPYFRLDVDTPNGRFFYELYHFLTGEAVDAPRPSSIGDRSYILCPDMPDNYLRPLH